MLTDLLTIIKDSEASQDRQFITALARGLTVLYALRFYPQGMSHQQISDLTELPKATVSRLLHTLTTMRFLRRQQSSGLYVADGRLRELVSAIQDGDYFIQEAKPLMMAFAERYEVSVSLAVEEGGEMRYLESIRSPARLAVQLAVGSTVPLVRTAIGRAYYSGLSQAQREALVTSVASAQTSPLAQSDATYQATLEAQREHYEQQGYCYSDGEFSHDITAIAVPVHHAGANKGLYAINASAPSSRMTLAQLVAQVATPLQDLARDLEVL